jgi:glutaminyl-peptide cyclotransferase
MAFRPCSAEKLIPDVVYEYNRNPKAFAWTEGLQWYRGDLYESTGSPTGNIPKGSHAPRVAIDSSLQRLKLEGNTVVVEQRFSLPFEYFGEGLARNGKRLYQLAQDSATVLVYELEPFVQLPALPRASQKVARRWGLCFDAMQDIFYLSDGSENLQIYLREQFERVELAEPIGHLEVTCDGLPIDQLNSLEFANGFIYAAVMNGDSSNGIIKINPTNGFVSAQIDAKNLRKRQDNPRAKDLNGIAFKETNPKNGRDVFFVTGKLWSKIFEVEFIPDLS